MSGELSVTGRFDDGFQFEFAVEHRETRFLIKDDTDKIILDYSAYDLGFQPDMDRVTEFLSWFKTRKITENEVVYIP